MNRNCSPALTVWLAFDSPDDEEASHEANTYKTDDGYRVDWYHNAVGLVSSVYFDTHDEACAYLEKNGYVDYTVED